MQPQPNAYQPLPDTYDEAFEARGRPRAHYLPLLESLAGADLDGIDQEVTDRLRAEEVTFGAGPEGLLALDPIPRLITASEWERIRAGIVQRARALDSFARDVYGERAIVAAGIIPERVIEGSAHYESAMRDADAPPVWVSVMGFDLVREPSGRFLVLEDQIRMPSGIAYAAAAREALRGLDPLPSPPSTDGSDAFAVLGHALRAAAPANRGTEPAVVLLSAGPDTAGWYEHERIGRELGIPVVTAEQLERRGDALHAHLGEETIEVDVVFQRTDEDRFTDSRGEPTAIGELLLGPCRAGNVACVNAPGSGVGDDKLVHAYVEEMVRFYLGEEPALASVETFDLGIEARREAAMAHREELVFKPRGGMGGEGVVVWSQSTADERAAVERDLARSPEQVIAQRRIELSCHPTICEGHLEPRRVDLRPYVIRTADRDWVLPGGLTRAALREGSLIVNSSQGGGVKDTWIVN